MSDERADRLTRLYDLDTRDEDDDIHLVVALARRTGGPILELAAGTGRVSVPLARAGYDVTAVDVDRAALDRAEHRYGPSRGPGSLRTVEADLLEVDLGVRYRLVLLCLNTLMLLAEREHQVTALRSMARHLEPGGLAVVDVWLPGPEDLAQYDGRLLLEWIRTDLETGEEVMKLGSATYDAATDVVSLSTIFDSTPAGGGPVTRLARSDRLRIVRAADLCQMAAEAGLEVELLAGDRELSPFGPGADRVVLLARLV